MGVSGLAAAVDLVDPDGESVDYTGKAPPFDVKLAAAQFRVRLLLATSIWKVVIGDIIESIRRLRLDMTNEMRKDLNSMLGQILSEVAPNEVEAFPSLANSSSKPPTETPRRCRLREPNFQLRRRYSWR